jgi:uncharacterized protein (DUF2235 family)
MKRFSIVVAISSILLIIHMMVSPSSGSAVSANNGRNKNLVLLSDGTGMEINGNYSNVLRLFRMLKRDSKQRVFYDPGLGTVKKYDPWHYISGKFGSFFGLATGSGLDENLLEAYEFLMDNYEEGDKIYLFGFSRGAYTMRALSGFIHLVGLLHPDQKNILPYALVAYKQAGNSRGGVAVAGCTTNSNLKAENEARRLGLVAGARKVDIEFVGLWDTVNSMVVPRPDRFYIPSIQRLPFTRVCPSVKHFRHACAIDERRRMFRVNKWLLPNGEKKWTEEERGNTAKKTTTKQVWFPGWHGDVGGGWPEEKSGLAKHALTWMVEEAKAKGLMIDDHVFKRICLGTEKSIGILMEKDVEPQPPNALADINNSLTLPWWPLELFPRRSRWKEWAPRWSFLGAYIPWAEPRSIPSDNDLHFSVKERMMGLPGYRPPNLMAYLKETGMPIPGETKKQK